MNALPDRWASTRARDAAVASIAESLARAIASVRSVAEKAKRLEGASIHREYHRARPPVGIIAGCNLRMRALS